MSEIHEMARFNRGKAIDRVIATAVTNAANSNINGSDMRMQEDDIAKDQKKIQVRMNSRTGANQRGSAHVTESN